MMNKLPFEPIISAYGLKFNNFSIKHFGNGHINNTFLISERIQPCYILQKINRHVFNNPQWIADNWKLAFDLIKNSAPDYNMLKFNTTLNRDDFFIDGKGEYWRLLPFISESVCFENVVSVKQAAEAAFTFGKFTALLKEAPISGFHIILPDFHNLSLRQKQLDSVIKKSFGQRHEMAEPLLRKLIHFRWLTHFYDTFAETLPLRIMHMDAKISNLLFDAKTLEMKYIIDFDTLMPGTILSDLGDLIRSMVCPAAEDETDHSRIIVRRDIFEVIMNAYFQALDGILTSGEIKVMRFAGPILVYMQAIRFLTDFLTNDLYYKIGYAEHNLDRATNQIILLEKLLEEPMCSMP
ncbi:MAG: hypothetical protein CVT92_04195 [Bacteroidetes bacterium HGW-Bacteroidetes-1]|jgi:hypothetical protein|nr:MAG: hypothetical protein CVT92_04195 [Bacteroidetes bacterium HGW-Bacteroidetes-1]